MGSLSPMAFDEGLAERVRDVLRDKNQISERKMFGGRAFMSRGHMLSEFSATRSWRAWAQNNTPTHCASRQRGIWISQENR